MKMLQRRERVEDVDVAAFASTSKGVNFNNEIRRKIKKRDFFFFFCSVSSKNGVHKSYKYIYKVPSFGFWYINQNTILRKLSVTQISNSERDWKGNFATIFSGFVSIWTSLRINRLILLHLVDKELCMILNLR